MIADVFIFFALTGFILAFVAVIIGSIALAAPPNSVITGQQLQGFVSDERLQPVTKEDTILSAFEKLNGTFERAANNTVFTTGAITEGNIAVFLNAHFIQDANIPAVSVLNTASPATGNLNMGLFEISQVGALSGATYSRSADNIVSNTGAGVAGNICIFSDSTGKRIEDSSEALSSFLKSIVSSNGFSATAGPNVTLSITPSGLLKGSSGAIAAATAADVTGQLLTGYSSTTGIISATDTILTAIGKLNGNISSAVLSIVSTNGFSATSGPNVTLSITPSGILKGSSGAIAAATAADITGQLLTSYSSTTGTITATDTILSAIGKLNGNQGNYLLLTGGTMLGTIDLNGLDLLNASAIRFAQNATVCGTNTTFSGSETVCLYGKDSTVNGNNSCVYGYNSHGTGSAADVFGSNTTNTTPNSLLFPAYTNIRVATTNTTDLGTSLLMFKDCYLRGRLYGPNENRLCNDIVSNTGEAVVNNVAIFSNVSGKVIADSSIPKANLSTDQYSSYSNVSWSNTISSNLIDATDFIGSLVYAAPQPLGLVIWIDMNMLLTSSAGDTFTVHFIVNGVPLFDQAIIVPASSTDLPTVVRAKIVLRGGSAQVFTSAQAGAINQVPTNVNVALNSGVENTWSFEGQWAINLSSVTVTGTSITNSFLYA